MGISLVCMERSILSTHACIFSTYELGLNMHELGMFLFK